MITDNKEIVNLYSDRFCHQFVMGPEYVSSLQSWQQIEVNPSNKITAHPELNLQQTKRPGISLTLLGYVLDYHKPKASDTEILNDLLDQSGEDIDRMIEASGKLGGRWALVAATSSRSIIFHDALGLRQIVYSNIEHMDALWVMSQPGIAQHLFDLDMHADAIEFLDSADVRLRQEYRWPLTATAFRKISRLLPNHYLNLDTGHSTRYWPNKELAKIELDAGLELLHQQLTGLMEALSHRQDFVIGMTAGLDSRLLLAACKNLQGKFSATTIRQAHMKEPHEDITVTTRLMEKLGISHKLVKSSPIVSPGFSKAFKENVYLSHVHYEPDAYAILKGFLREKVVVTGSGSEVGRLPNRNDYLPGQKVFSAIELAEQQNMDNSDFAIKQIEKWLNETRNTHDVHLLDIFSWEQAHGVWLASTQIEFDIAWREIFTPYNCRDLLVTLLRIDEKYRQQAENQVYNMLIERMWPALLQVPVNPDSAKKKSGKNNRIKIVKKNIKRKIKSILT